MKKLVAILMTLTLLLSVAPIALAEDVPTITMMLICGSVPGDKAMVEEELSKITREKIGCNVEFICMEIGNAATQTNLLLSGGDSTMDVYVALSFSQTYLTVVNNGQALQLDELLAPYMDDIKATLGESVVDAGYVNGKLYGLPRLLDQASTAVFNLRADIAAEFGYKNGDKVTLDELTTLFSNIRAAYPETPVIGPMNGGPNMSDTRVDRLGNNLGVLTNYGQTTTVSNYFESEEYTDLVAHIKQWKDMGAYMPDLLNMTDAPSDYIPAGRAFGCFASHFSAELNGIWATQNFGVEMASLQIYEDAVATTPGAYYCVNPATKNADKCAAFVALMATDKDVVNLLVNGIEGVHYQVLEDGSAAYLDGKNVATTGWCMGYSWMALNSTLSAPFNYPADYYQQMIAANNSANRSLAFGCQFDLTGVADAVSACSNVVNQYANAILSGAVDDIDATVAAFQQALRNAGIDEIIAAKQVQLDAFLAK